jgi:precorrin-6A/cobalt-precorrin-6A reductase
MPCPDPRRHRRGARTGRRARGAPRCPGHHVSRGACGAARGTCRGVRVGGFGAAEGLARWLREQHVDALVDATHPFAETITANAARAATATGVPAVVLRRPDWRPDPGDRWHLVDSLHAAADLLPRCGSQVFLTTGRTSLAAFAHLRDRHFVVRSVELSEPPMPPHTGVLPTRGPFTAADESALLREHCVDVLVTKDSGAEATAAKLMAARELALPVVVVRRPPLPDGVALVPDVAASSPGSASTCREAHGFQVDRRQLLLERHRVGGPTTPGRPPLRRTPASKLVGGSTPTSCVNSVTGIPGSPTTATSSPARSRPPRQRPGPHMRAPRKWSAGVPTTTEGWVMGGVCGRGGRRPGVCCAIWCGSGRLPRSGWPSVRGIDGRG